MNKQKLIYVSSPYYGKVTESQVYEYLEYVYNKGYFKDILLLQESGNTEQKSAEILSRYSFRYILYSGSAMNPFKRLKTKNILQPILQREVDSDTVFHVRSDIRALCIYEALPSKYQHLPILTEFRGDVISEMTINNIQKNLLSKLRSLIVLNYYTQRIKKLSKIDSISCSAVSDRLCDTISQWGIPTNRIVMRPNIAAEYFGYDNQARKTLRKDFGLNETDIVVAFSNGEGARWQNDDITINSLLDKGYYILNLSKKPVDRPRIINKFLAREEMPKYLSASDAAVLWREDNAINNVACPSKFGEFAVMGLYLIHNGTVDIATSFINDNKCGQIVNNPEDIIIPSEILSEDERYRRAECGKKLFSVVNVAQSYLKSYQTKC